MLRKWANTGGYFFRKIKMQHAVECSQKDQSVNYPKTPKHFMPYRSPYLPLPFFEEETQI
jgi:hypothetical protein